MLPSPRFVSKHRDFKQFKQLPTPSLTIPISWSLRFLLPLFTGWREPVDVHPSSPDPGRCHQIIFLNKNTLGKDGNAIPTSPQASARITTQWSLILIPSSPLMNATGAAKSS